MSVERELDALGSGLGAMRWVQGPGGNVSIKDADTLFVKASGVRLCTVREHHAAVPLPLARRALAGDAAADALVFGLSPRPSLETYFHVLGPRVVAHTHALGALLLACATASFGGLEVPTIPYERPGRGIALAVERTFGEEPPRGLVLLASHGLIAFADTVDEAIQATQMFDEQVRRAIGGTLPDIDALLGESLAVGEVAPLAGGFSRRIAPRQHDGRALFPDAVVYAGHLRASDVTAATAERALREVARPVVLVNDEGHRLVVARRREQLDYAVEVAVAHDWLDDALSARGLARYLPDDEPARILDLPAEKYRLNHSFKER